MISSILFWIFCGLLAGAFPFIAWLIFVREPRLNRDAKTLEQVEREIQMLALKALNEPRQG